MTFNTAFPDSPFFPLNIKETWMNLLFISLGCDKNLVDSEVMLGLLDAKGYGIVDDEEQADVIVINTCCFIHDAKEESIQTILEMAEYKKTGRLKALVVTGCLAQRYQQEILDEIPGRDHKRNSGGGCGSWNGVI